MPELTEEAKKLVEATQWPERAEDATADALIVHGARLALAWEAETRPLSRRAFKMAKDDPERPEALRRYVDATAAMIAEAQVTAALVAIQEVSREQADEVARRLWHYTDDGGLLSELMFDYLDARGISSETVWEAAQQDAASHVPNETPPAEVAE